MKGNWHDYITGKMATERKISFIIEINDLIKRMRNAGITREKTISMADCIGLNDDEAQALKSLIAVLWDHDGMAQIMLEIIAKGKPDANN